jgi:hypothetical protein
MDDIRDQFATGRRKMIDAFVRISDLARRAGVDEDTISACHGEFFDGNVETKDAFGVAAFLAQVRMASGRPTPRRPATTPPDPRTPGGATAEAAPTHPPTGHANAPDNGSGTTPGPGQGRRTGTGVSSGGSG